MKIIRNDVKTYPRIPCFYAPIAMIALLMLNNAHSEEPISKERVRESDIKIIEMDLKLEKAEKNNALTNRKIASKRAKDIQKEILATAKVITTTEQKLIKVEENLGALNIKNTLLSQRLQDKEKELQTVLLALQRLAIRPHGSLVIQPLVPNDAIRSGLILSATIPILTTKAAALEQQLSVLFETRREIAIQKAEISQKNQELTSKRKFLDILFSEQKDTQDKLTQKALQSGEKIKELAKEARDLRQLLDQILAEKKSRQDMQVVSPGNQIYYPEYKLPRLSTVIKKKPLGYIKREVFSGPGGTSPFPVAGKIIKKYGEKVSGAESSKGIVIATRPNAQVISSFDGVVVFSGKFRGYGELLILEHNQGYHTLLSGMRKIRNSVGEYVLAGEPLGKMPRIAGSALYWELRRNKQPINPLPWFGGQHSRE